MFAIEQKYGVTVPWFQYQQIYNLFHNYYLKDKLKKELTTFESLLLKGNNHSSGVISLIYKLLNVKEWSSFASFEFT